MSRLQRILSPAPLALVALVGVLLTSAAARAEWDRQRMNPAEEERGFVDICAVSPNFAAAVGVIKQGQNDTAVVFVTRDGLEWYSSSPQTGGGPLDLHVYMSCWFADEQNGAVGGIGEIWVTHDSAATWTKVGLGGLMGGRTVNGMDGLADGSSIFAVTSTGQVLRSDDGGDTWPEWARPLGDSTLAGVQFLDDQTGWVWAGTSEAGPGESRVYSEGGFAYTTDGGDTWTTVFSGEARQVVGVHFIDDRRGWMITRATSDATLERTDDGGATWEPVAGPSESTGGTVEAFTAIHFFDRCEGMLAAEVGPNGAGSIYRTTDGGTTWTEFDREFLHLGGSGALTVWGSVWTFDFVDRNLGWGSGSYATAFRYDADDDPPACEGGGDGDGDGGGGGGRCSCRAPGAAPTGSSGWAWLGVFAALLLWRVHPRR